MKKENSSNTLLIAKRLKNGLIIGYRFKDNESEEKVEEIDEE